MPMYYGEGSHAFVRLQEALSEYNDESGLFCWYWDSTIATTWSSVFAPHPRYFNASSLSHTATLCTQNSQWKRNWYQRYKNHSSRTWNPFIIAEDNSTSTGTLQHTSRLEIGAKQPPKTQSIEDSRTDVTDEELQTPSLFSGDTLSVSSVSLTNIMPIQTTGIQQLTKTLLEHPQLGELCHRTVSQLSDRKSRVHLKGFLREYGENLLREASNTLEVEASTFVKRFASQLANEIHWSIKGYDDYVRNEKMGSSMYDLENWLVSVRGAANVETTSENQDIVEDQSNALDGEIDELDGDDEASGVVTFPTLDSVKEYLVSSRAFELLLRRLRVWLNIRDQPPEQIHSKPMKVEEMDLAKPQPEVSDLRDTGDGQHGQIEDQTMPKSAETSSTTSDALHSARDWVRIEDETVSESAETSSTTSDTLYSARDWTQTEGDCCSTAEFSAHEPLTLSQDKDLIDSNAFVALASYWATQTSNYSAWDIGSGLLDYWGVSFLLHDLFDMLVPKVPLGHERIRWRCSCNTLLWGDFEIGSTEALRQLKFELSQMTIFNPFKRTEPPISTRPWNTYNNPGTTQGQTGMQGQTQMTGMPPGSFGHQSNSTNTQQHLSNSTGADTNGLATGPYVINMPNANPITIDPRFFEICLNTGNHGVHHEELDISAVTSDRELFEKIWDRYNNNRKSITRRVFLRPRNVHFVMFSLSRTNQYGAGIHKKPEEYPPEEELKHGRYHYLCPKIMMPKNIFLHYLHRARWNIWGEHAEDVWLKRLPKKLKESLLRGLSQKQLQQMQNNSEPDLVFGWGVHVLDGPNHAVLAVLLAIGIILSFVISGLVIGFANTQEQGFSVGQYLLTIMSCIMAAIYFQLTDQ